MISFEGLTFSVVIPCYNDRENIAALLASLRLPGEGWEVIVVDDCSPQGPPALLDTLAAMSREAAPSLFGFVLAIGAYAVDASFAGVFWSAMLGFFSAWMLFHRHRPGYYFRWDN